MGLLLNLLMPGLGFSYLGATIWHLAWFVCFAALCVGYVFYPESSLLALAAAGYAVCQVQYAVCCGPSRKQAQAGAPMTRLMGLGMSHSVLGFYFLAFGSLGYTMKDDPRYLEAYGESCMYGVRWAQDSYHEKYGRYAPLAALGDSYKDRCPDGASITEIKSPTAREFGLRIIYREKYIYTVSQDSLKQLIAQAQASQVGRDVMAVSRR